MANFFRSLLRRLFGADDDPIEAPAPLPTGYQSRTFYSSSTSPSTPGSDHAQSLICRPSSSSTQSNISHVTKLRVSPLHDKVNKLSPNPPSSIEAQLVTGKSIATDLTSHRSYQANSLMSPASPSPSPTAPKPSTQKQMSNSFALSNANLVSSKRPLESSSTFPPTVPSSTSSLPALKPKVAIPVFKVPDELEHEFEGGRVPRILLTPLSQSTYREYFTALICAEDYFCEKWSDYLLQEVVLEIREESTSDKNKKFNVHGYHSQMNDRKKFVVFEIDSIPERRPYLLSRDFVHLKPTHKQIKPFEGIVLRVANSSFVHTQFGNDFHLQHTSTSKYDVSFSFNRVCLKRCHFAIRAITDSIFQNFLFPDQSPRVIDTDQDQEQVIFYNQALSSKERAAVGHILNLWCPPPYLLVGPLCMPTRSKSHTTSPCELSTTGRVIREAVLQIYRADPASRILIATPWNKTCDVLMQSLTNCIPAHELFRANAAFRAVEDVPGDILDLTMYDSGEECFAMTTLPDLLKFRVISTTFMSSFRLYNEGVKAGHFSHVFLVDASSVIEPEVLVALVNLVDVMTAVVVTGSRGDCPNRIRSDISRKRGLKVSYFERLLKSSLYSSENPSFLSYL